jgi:hypothetical protein
MVEVVFYWPYSSHRIKSYQMGNLILFLLGKLGKCYLSYIVVSNTMVNSQCLELLV